MDMYFIERIGKEREVVLVFSLTVNMLIYTQREKEGDLAQSYDETPIPTENSKTNGLHKNRHQNIDYTTIMDRIRSVICSNNSHPND